MAVLENMGRDLLRPDLARWLIEGHPPNFPIFPELSRGHLLAVLVVANAKRCQ